TVELKWVDAIPHQTEAYHLEFHPGEGQEVVIVAADIPATEHSFEWQVPSEPCTDCSLVVIQDNAAADYSATRKITSVLTAEEIPLADDGAADDTAADETDAADVDDSSAADESATDRSDEVAIDDVMDDDADGVDPSGVNDGEDSALHDDATIDDSMLDDGSAADDVATSGSTTRADHLTRDATADASEGL